MKKRSDLLFIIGILILTSFILATYPYTNLVPNPGHGADEVFIHINNKNISLQQAIIDGEFDSAYTGGSYSNPPNQSHNGNEIIVNINNTIKTFQQAINDGTLCLAEQGTSPNNFGIITGKNQTGDEIIIDFNWEKTLQDAINNGDFGACVVNDPINLALTGTKTFTHSNLGGSGVSWYATANYVSDDNTGTWVGVYRPGSNHYIDFTSTIMFDKTASEINKIEYVVSGYPTYYPYGTPWSGYLQISLYYGGTWNTIDSRWPLTGSYSWTPPQVSTGLQTTTILNTWNNVEGIRARGYVSAPSDYIMFYLRELEAWGFE